MIEALFKSILLGFGIYIIMKLVFNQRFLTLTSLKTRISILTLFISANVIAQTESMYKQNSFQFSVGINQIKEGNLHYKVHKGAIYSLSYAHTKVKKNYSVFDVQIQFSKIKTRFENASNSMNIQVGTNYGYLFELINNDKLSLYTGPNLSAKYRLSYYPNWDDSHLYWADDISLGLANKLKYKFTENTALTLDLKFTLLSTFNRPEQNRDYKIDDVSFGGILTNMNSDFEFGTINSGFNLQFQTEYCFKLSPKIEEAIIYSFDYSILNAKEGNPFYNIQHKLGLKLLF
jgi:hypothetical protein